MQPPDHPSVFSSIIEEQRKMPINGFKIVRLEHKSTQFMDCAWPDLRSIIRQSKKVVDEQIPQALFGSYDLFDGGKIRVVLAVCGLLGVLSQY